MVYKTLVASFNIDEILSRNSVTNLGILEELLNGSSIYDKIVAVTSAYSKPFMIYTVVYERED